MVRIARATRPQCARSRLRGDQRVAKTKVIKKNLNPYWNETWVIPIVKRDPSVFLKFECWDEDPFTDDPLGYFVVYLNDLQVRQAPTASLASLDEPQC